MKIIGLTGNSGSGKSAVCNILRAKGAFIIDCDDIAHGILEYGTRAYFETVNCFGKEILNSDESINRRLLGSIAFGCPQKLEQLNSITHKHIIEEVIKQLNNIKNNSEYKYIVIDAPLLTETGLHSYTDEVWLVDAAYETKLSRIMQRDALSEEEARKRLLSQTPALKLKKYADVVINNDFSGIEELEAVINKLLYV